MTYTPELGAVTVSTGNSTSLPLGISGIFTGVAENISQFTEISLNLYASPNTADGVLYFEFSPNSVNWDVSVPLVVSDPTVFIPFPLRTVLPWFRVRYVNNGVAQTAFRLTTVYHSRTSKNLTRLQGQVAGSSEPTEIIRALIEPSLGARQLALSADRGIFGTRVSQIVAQFDRPLANNAVTAAVSGGGSVTQGLGQALLRTGVAVTASARMETNRSIRYAPAREVYGIFTSRFTTPTHSNSFQRAGLYNDVNGFFLGYQGMVFGVFIRSGGVDLFIPRISWNGDPLDGTAFSLFTRDDVSEPINFSLYNVFRIRYGWLGSAPVHFEVMAPDGHWVTLHVLTQPNSSISPHITDPNLPVRMEVIKSVADATDLIMGTGSWDAGVVGDNTSYTIGELRGHTPFQVSLSNQTASATLRTIPTGRVGKVTTLIISCVNDSIGTNGLLNIRDGSGGAIILPVMIQARAGVAPGFAQLVATFSQPLEFISTIYLEESIGNLTYCVAAVGYDAEQ